MSVEHWEDEEGTRYVSCDAFCVGDYGGSGSIGEANIRSVQDDKDCIIRYGAYSSKQAWLIATPENEELCRGLDEDYPLIDDEKSSEVELEWEWEAWTGWLQNDLNYTLPDELGEVIGDDLTDEEQWECYREAMQECNEYPIPEYNGVYVRIDNIKEAYAEIVIARLTGSKRE